jgi:hypothetical protein
MLQTMRDIGGVEIPESLIKLSDGATDLTTGTIPPPPRVTGKPPVPPAQQKPQA